MTTPRPLPPTRFVAFYSYKGGVGRTLALANCARAMAAGGKRVVLLDFDLEAPGLHHFDTLKPGQNAAGFVEYLQACLAGQTPESLDEYVHPCPGQEQDRGKAWIMPAGRHNNPAYLDFLNGMNWSEFYSEKTGYQILENLRGHLMAQFRPDYVLMDARTGLSEIGGIATHQLADIVVLLFNLSEQNLHGAERIFHSVKQSPMQPKIILVASPVPTVFTGPETPFRKRMDFIRQQFVGAENTDKPLVIPYNPLLAFGEQILVDEHDDPFSSDAPYLELVNMVKQAAEVDVDVCLEKSMEAWSKGDLSKARAVLEKAVQDNLEDPNIWFNLGVLSQSLNEPEKAIDAYSQLVERFGNSDNPELQEQVADALVNQGNAFGVMGKTDEALAAYTQVLERFGSSDQPELQESIVLALINQGFTHICLAKQAKALGDQRGFQQHLADAETSLEKARDQRQYDDLRLQNCAYLLYLQGHPDEAETTLLLALEAGGSKVLDDCRGDAEIHRLPEDDGFLALVDKLAAEKGLSANG